MRNKIFATAMSVVALAVMFLLPVGLDAIDTTKPETSQTTTTTTTTYGEETTVVTTTVPQSEGEVTTVPTSDSGDESITTTVTVPAESETEKTTTTTVAKDTEKPATTTVSTTKSTTTKKTTTVTTTKKSTTTTKKKTTTTMTTTKKTTTTTKKPADLSSIDAPAGSPVKQHGQLSVNGANIVDQNGKVFQILGMSTHGIMWEDFSDILTYDSLKVLRDDWGINTIRIAMYTEEWGGYTTGADFAKQAKEKVNNGVKNASDLGLYVIIDWHILHDNDPLKHKSEAVAFFKEMSAKYKDYPNVIYEICNEPNGGNVKWDTHIKPYAEEVIKTIRANDKDAIIICGTGTWSQDIHDANKNRLSDKNTVYALHFYANTHKDWLRDRVTDCYNSGLPILVSEFGTCDSSGNGGFNSSETKKWLTLLNSKNIGYLNWSACGKSETASAFKSGTNLKKIQAGTSQLTESGKLIREEIRKRAGL